jgi:hypothetical protein
MFRKFGPVAVRILVGKEIVLDRLVTRLNELDEKDIDNPDTLYRLNSSPEFHDEGDPEQKRLMEDIEIKLKDYCEINIP